MSKKKDIVTVDRRVAEEELCWAEYEKAKAAEEAENAAQMQAMFDSMDSTDKEEDHSYLDISEPAERTMRRNRRRGEIKAKKRTVRNAAEATANAKAREEHDKESITQRDRGTGEKVNGRKSQMSRTEKLVKKAEKVRRKK